jgi:hypothetical protein
MDLYVPHLGSDHGVQLRKGLLLLEDLALLRS